MLILPVFFVASLFDATFFLMIVGVDMGLTTLIASEAEIEDEGEESLVTFQLCLSPLTCSVWRLFEMLEELEDCFFNLSVAVGAVVIRTIVRHGDCKCSV